MRRPEPIGRPPGATSQFAAGANEQMVANLKKGHIDIYFVGDSITRRSVAPTDYPRFLDNWNKNFFGWNAADYGWGGDTIQNILLAYRMVS